MRSENLYPPLYWFSNEVYVPPPPYEEIAPLYCCIDVHALTTNVSEEIDTLLAITRLGIDTLREVRLEIAGDPLCGDCLLDGCFGITENLRPASR
jgi:hypothetical protein